jgi:methionyl-tRNA formyltransferase
MGTPDFALPCLERIAADGHELCGVFTQTDKPKGRRMTLTPPPVKTAALKLNIPVYQPDTLKDEATIELIRSLKPQLIVVVAYGRILSQAGHSYPRLRKRTCFTVAEIPWSWPDTVGSDKRRAKNRHHNNVYVKRD